MRKEDKIVHAIISSEVNSHFLHEVQFTSIYKQDVKKKVNSALKALQEHSGYFKTLENAVEDSTIDVTDTYFDFIKEVSEVSINEMGELKGIIRAYREDPKAILGIAKKILK